MSELVHTLNRGVDKRQIFMDDQDHFRFVRNLYEFNDEDPVINISRSFQGTNMSDFVSHSTPKKSRKLLVDIHVFCLMPNHYHLLLSERTEGGIVKFMRKLNIGYAKYFNERYERTGALFEGRYKAVAVKEQAHFIHLPYYIHANPLDLYDLGWRSRKIKNQKRALDFLRKYRWSSLLDYSGKKNFPSVISQTFLGEVFGKASRHGEDFAEWLREMEQGALKGISLE